MRQLNVVLFKNTPSNDYAEVRKRTHFACCHINGKWMLEQEDLAESANTHLGNRFVFFIEQKISHDC